MNHSTSYTRMHAALSHCKQAQPAPTAQSLRSNSTEDEVWQQGAIPIPPDLSNVGTPRLFVCCTVH